MARAKKEGPSISGIWRAYFRSRPELLKRSNNDEVYQLFQKDHPEIELTERVRAVCANVKSTEKKRFKKVRKQKKAEAAAETAAAGRQVTRTGAGRRGSASALEGLEERIYDCIVSAKEHDRDGLDGVIRHLRQALVSLSAKFV